MATWVKMFAEGRADERSLLGGKGANLAEMTRMGLPVPQGFTITTEACRHFEENGKRLTTDMKEEMSHAIERLEAITGKRFGDEKAPLLVSVRSGAAVSMPGMMDTILNLGLNDAGVIGLGEQCGDMAFAFDCYRRLIQMYGEIVLGLRPERFMDELDRVMKEKRVAAEHELTVADWQEIVKSFKQIIKQEKGEVFPQDPQTQLEGAVRAVFASWYNSRAVVYRKHHGISETLGTAVNVQQMVFGNMTGASGTGVLFSRNPSTGEKGLYGEFLPHAQGEDVVSGVRTPRPIAHLQQDHPELYAQLEEIAQRLEQHYRDMQDIEFTIEQGKLYVLQTRNGKRTTQAALVIAVDLAQQNVITREEALLRIQPASLDQLLHPNLHVRDTDRPLAKGLAASPGAATGQIVIDPAKVLELSKRGENVIFVRPETTPDDLEAIMASRGILTSRGGMTSHAAVVARSLGKPCVCGCEAVEINIKDRTCDIAGTLFREGEVLTLDGATGDVYEGELELKESGLFPEFHTLLGWAKDSSRLTVLANADTERDATKARELGADGIGLCRTEHMFMGPERLPVMQHMIMAETEAEQERALAELQERQTEDFVGIFRAMDGLTVTVRLLDPPLHEFLPAETELLPGADMASSSHVHRLNDRERERWRLKLKQLQEANPMLGHRGCRLGVTHPHIYTAQVNAIIEAAIRLRREGVFVKPAIMVPLIAHANELKEMVRVINQSAAHVMEVHGVKVPYEVGTMVETPRAALTMDEWGDTVQFISFGTNDLTQTTFGFSRDDAERKFLGIYLERGILTENPFVHLDVDGVGRLMEWGLDRLRKRGFTLKSGICGEHGGQVDGVKFAERTGMDYVSCSPYRIPLAILTAAQATIRSMKKVRQV